MLDDILDMTDEARLTIEKTLALFEPFDNPLIEYRPHGLKEINAVFGDPTRGGKYRKVCDPVWKKRWIIDCHPRGDAPPIHPKLARYWWACHKKAEPTFRELLRRIEIVAPGYITESGGTWSYNFRRIRHDTPEKAKKEGRSLRPLSWHSWGIAIDIEPKRNGGKTFAPGKTPKMWSAAWKKCWPDGITPAIYGVMKAMGLRLGIEWRGYVDPMHGELQGGRVQV